MPMHKFIGNKILTWLENKALGLHLSEYHSGFRIYSCKALSRLPFEKCSDNFHFDTEIIIQFMLAGLKIAERPIPTYYGTEKCHVNLVGYALNILKTLVKFGLHKNHLKKYAMFEIR
jgi:hypothetical protein